jgi:tetratricopeptide (TPR) repeat protein
MKYFVLAAMLLTLNLDLTAQKKKSKEQAAPAKTETVNQSAAVTSTNTQVSDTAKISQQEAEVNLLINHFYVKYQVANQFADYDVARSALYDLIIEFPANDSLLLSLGFLYYENQKYPSAVLVGQELLARNSKNPAALELTASSYEGLNINEKALQNYESLYLLSNSLSVLYKVSFLQYGLNRYQECLANTDIILASKEADEVKVAFTTTDNKTKEYSIRIPILNLKGMVARDTGDKASAKKYFEQALTLAPDFQAAKDNLAKLK